MSADAAGRFRPLWLNQDLEYRAILTNADGVPVYDQDPLGIFPFSDNGLPLDDSGEPMPFASRIFWRAATTAFTPIYTDDTLTTELDNPLTADSAGQFPDIYLDDALQYRTLLKDGDGTLIYDIDNYQFLVPVPPLLVPDVIGQTLASATDEIVSASFIVGVVTEEFSDTVPAGLVISQTPVGGTEAAAGTAVDLVLSLGVEPLDPILVSGRNFEDVTASYMTSVDGVTWTLQSNPAMVSVKAICFSRELQLFVAVGYAIGATGGMVQTSPDGVTWTTRIPASNAHWNDVCWSPVEALFVAVSSNGGASPVMTSPDGINWSGQTAPDQVWNAVRWLTSAGLFVAGGTAPGALDPNSLMSSPDGVDWTIRAAPLLGSFAFQTSRMCVSPTYFHCTNRSEGSSMRSSDGINWTLITDLVGGQTNSAFGESTLVIITGGGVGSRFEYSLDDGTTLHLSTALANDGCEGGAYSVELGLFVATGASVNGQNAYYSADGITWTPADTPLLSDGNQWFCVCAGTLPSE